MVIYCALNSVGAESKDVGAFLDYGGISIISGKIRCSEGKVCVNRSDFHF